MVHNKKAWAVVTGASAGIGRGIAQRLVADGFGVITIDRVTPRALLHGEEYFQADLADKDRTAQVLAEIADRYDVSVLVNNVGIVRPAAIEEATLEDLHAVVAVNLGCTLQCAQAFIPQMKQARHGRIINI